jgi:exodeoxyribonuclease V alpha subunit
LRSALAQLGSNVPASTAPVSPLADSRVILEQSRRFGVDSGIGRLARAINGGQVDDVMHALQQGRADLQWLALDETAIKAEVMKTAREVYADYLQAPDPAAALNAFNRFRFLCALREGAFGVEAVNGWVEQSLRQAGLLQGGERHYRGRPVMVTRNDYSLGLFNGDVGLLWPDGEGRLRAFFVQADGTMKKVLLTRLPEHETVFAMTVHKSQGSEFDRCTVVLPDRDSPILTRELLYTGITRARATVTVWATANIIATTVARRVTRRSGLREALWGE